MDREPLPIVDSEGIDPRMFVAPEDREKQDRHLADPERLSQQILEWWKGDAHTHSQASSRPEYGHLESQYSREEILEYYERLGLEFAVFAEHATNPGKPEVIDVDHPISQSFLREAAEVTALNREREAGPIALSGTEANILFDAEGQPAVDLPFEVLEKLDLVIGSRHAIANEKDPAAIRESLVFAAQHPQIDVLGHPDRNATVRDSQDPVYWERYWAIWSEILTEAKKHNKAVEINLNPFSQPDARLVQMMVEAEVPLFINYDAHDFNVYRSDSPEQQAGRTAAGAWAAGNATEADLDTIEAYKANRLSHGPGFKAIRLMVRWIKRLQEMGVTPDRVVNSSKERLLEFLTVTRGKRTENLVELTK